MNTGFQEETLDELRTRTGLGSKFAWTMMSGISAACYREKGEDALKEVWRRLMTAEQKDRFLAALDKLGIRDYPPAVSAALYHYFSNSIGGLKLEVVVEHRRKAWIRYLSPWGTYPGIAALVMPASIRRHIFTIWHPRNGELLGCPRLGWVLTKSVADGHPYDEGYFYEYDHDLRPEERMRFEHVDRSPEFKPDEAPKLDSNVWPEARILKGGFNYSVDYVRHLIKVMYEIFGIHAANDVIRTAMRLLGIQFCGEFVQATGEHGKDSIGVARHIAALFASFRNPVEVSGDASQATLKIGGLLPFAVDADPELRASIFEFFAMSVRLRNGHLSIRRISERGEQAEIWTIKDEGHWLW